jgi:hypothetical protein
MMRALLIALLVVAACSVGVCLRSPGGAQAQGPAKRLQWQYTVYDHRDLMALGEKTISQNLSKLGEQGWELVAVTPGIRGDKGADVISQTTYVFKRPR